VPTGCEEFVEFGKAVTCAISANYGGWVRYIKQK